MSSKQSQHEANLAYLYARLDAVQMSGYERLRAKARLAQAEAVADAVFRVIGLVKRVLNQQKSVDEVLPGKRRQSALIGTS